VTVEKSPNRQGLVVGVQSIRLGDERMNALLLITIALVLPAQAQPQPREKGNEKMAAVKLDGAWTVTYAELDGKKIEGKGFTQVTIKNNVVTCRHDGKEKTWRLEFGPHHMVRCTEQIDGKVSLDNEKRDSGEKSQHTHYGVYVASQEYFCLSMHKGHDRRSFGSTERREGQAQPGSGLRFGDQAPHAGHFVLILQRASSSPTPASK